MKFGFSVNIDKKNKNKGNESTSKELDINKEIKQLVKEEIKQMASQTGMSKTSETYETSTITEISKAETITETSVEKEHVEIEVKTSEVYESSDMTSTKLSQDNSSNQLEDTPKKKKVQFINNSNKNKVDHKTLFFFEKCNYDCKVKFKCMFSIACINNAIKKTKDAVVNAVSCVASTTAKATCTATKAIASGISTSVKYVAKGIYTAASNVKYNVVYASKLTAKTIKRSYHSITHTISHSYIVRKIISIRHTKVWIVSKKYTKLFFIYILCIWICRRKHVVDENSDEYKEEYIKNNATYSTEFDHLPILGDDAIV